ncbi:MAG: MBOAT family protein [Bacteroidales bacterium]
MVFSSHLFLFWFLPLALALYYVIKSRYRHALLTLLSYLFYGWTNPLFVLLMFLSTVIDYLCGLVLTDTWRPGWKGEVPLLPAGEPRNSRQKWAVTLSVVSNLSLLGFFKYANFGLDNWNHLMEALRLSDTWLLPSLHIVLPLGISFYTFQSMSYAIDVYRGDARGIRRFVDFACYVSLFPQLVAGPIIRFQEVANQLQFRLHTFEKFARGVAFFVLGMAQKILLANPCGKLADWAFDTPGRAVAEAWTGLAAYSFQIFFDFAGYSNMAIGLGLMLGFVFPKNFDAPYRSASITEFWRRWHISLSSWLRDYLYIPLGGNRKGRVRTYINLMLVMLLGGLWHGASWNFLIWGAIHGFMLCLDRIRQRKKNRIESDSPTWIGQTVGVATTYIVVLIAWVFFRAPSLPEALQYLQSMAGIAPVADSARLLRGLFLLPYGILSLGVAAFFAAFAPQAWDWTRTLTPLRGVILLLLFLLSVAALTTQSYNPFIYFIF